MVFAALRSDVLGPTLFAFFVMIIETVAMELPFLPYEKTNQ
jgi:hypothetical protein